MFHEKSHDVKLVKKPQSLIKVGTLTLTLLISPVFLKALFAMPGDIRNMSLHLRWGRAADTKIPQADIAKPNGADMASPLPPSGLITYR